MKYTVKLTNGEVFEHLTRGVVEQWQEAWDNYLYTREDKTLISFPKRSILYRMSEPKKK